MRITPTRLAILLALSLAAPRGAWAQNACPAAADSARTDSASAAVVIVASVSARELRFDAPPKARLRVLGCEGGLQVLERRNLPEQVQPGVTYRDVYVSVRILGPLNAACIAALAGDSAALRGLGGASACLPARTVTAPPAPPPE